MINFDGIYKIRGRVGIEGLNFKIEKGLITSIECNDERSDLLIDMIIGDEIPAKGNIFIDEMKSKDYFAKKRENFGIVLNGEGYYEKLTVNQYLKFFKNIHNSKENLEELLMRTALMDIGDKKIRELSNSVRKRISITREILKSPEIMIIQQPILNMDNSSARVISDVLQYLKERGTTVLIISPSFKNTMTLGDKSYSLCEEGIQELENRIQKDESIEVKEDKQMFKVKKISSKVDDKILLFNPTDIDYIESANGVCNLNVLGEEFPCSLSLGELEERLKNFGFFRSHRSYLVNLQQVKEMVTWTRNSYSLNLNDKNKSSVPLSKGRIDQFKEILNL